MAAVKKKEAAQPKEKKAKSSKELSPPEYTYNNDKGEPVFGVDWSSGSPAYSHLVTVGKAKKWAAGRNNNRLLYRLPEVLKAQEIILVSSEPTAEVCMAAGLVATTCPDGFAGWLPSYTDYLRGKVITILTPPEEKRTEIIFQSLYGKAHDVRIISIEAGLEEDFRLGTVNKREVVKLLKKKSEADFVAMIEAKKKRITDSGNAEMFAFLFADQVRYCKQWGSWLVWSEGRWKRDEEGIVETMVKSTIDKIWEEVRMHHKRDSKHFNELIEWAKKSRSRGGRKNVEALARKEASIKVSANELDKNPMLLNFRNGVLDLETHEFREHDRIEYHTKQCPFDYDPGEIYPHRWRNFLSEIFADTTNPAKMIAYLREMIGITLTGTTPVQAFWFCYGKGANGKSVFLQTIQSILGSYADTTPTETLMHSDRTSIPNDVARLQGLRMVAASEIEDGRRWNESRIKDLTGGDTITARFLHKEFFTFKPEFKLWIAGNHKPGLRGTDHGIQRRVKLIPFTSTIPQEKRIPFEEMKASLLAEASGIINWALEGLKLFREDGYWEPEDVSAATREYFSENDLIGQFLDEACELDKSGIARITKKELYAHFSTYSEENGLRPMSNVKFSLLISERGFDESKSAGERCWIGIRKARPAAPPEEDPDSLMPRQPLKFAQNGK
ncbi:MAG: hypothetical protein F9K24_20695 [Leptonema illini]|uniref:SF3 helicase domain-containing protein n=1 Tax=Leptonema illini TaxID=183 RepID=A0A833LV44_9LEPT|nr:MAG: hypothetical protein F9K24_20695 [Leptonema illini]